MKVLNLSLESQILKLALFKFNFKTCAASFSYLSNEFRKTVHVERKYTIPLQFWYFFN